MDASSEHLGRLTSQAAVFGTDRLSRVLDILGELGAEIRWSSDPRLSIEVALTRMARPQGDLSLDALAARVEELEQAATTRGLSEPQRVASRSGGGQKRRSER